MTGRRGPSATATGSPRSRSSGRRRRRRCSTLSGAIDALGAPPRRSSSARSSRCCPSSPWAVQVGRLRCLRGIDTLTAVGLCAEIGDFERFARAEQLMSYVGLVPCESTTGQQRRLGSITKTGSGHARRLLVEAAWHYRPRPRIGKALTDRQDGQPPEAVAIAWSSPAAPAPHLDTARAAREAAHDHRRRRRPRTRRLLLGDHPHRVTRTRRQHLSRRLGRWRPGNARGTRDTAMSNPPPQGLATPDPRQRLPTTNHGPAVTQPAHISLTARRAQPAGPPPTQPTTTTTTPTRTRKSTTPLDKRLSISALRAALLTAQTRAALMDSEVRQRRGNWVSLRNAMRTPPFTRSRSPPFFMRSAPLIWPPVLSIRGRSADRPGHSPALAFPARRWALADAGEMREHVPMGGGRFVRWSESMGRPRVDAQAPEVSHLGLRRCLVGVMGLQARHNERSECPDDGSGMAAFESFFRDTIEQSCA